jgi:ubiquinol-cytochrome c reductase cytochrome b subunit
VDVHPRELVGPALDRYGGGALFLLLIALPFVDRNPHRSWRHRPVAMGIALLVLLIVVVLTVLMAFTEPVTHLGEM